MVIESTGNTEACSCLHIRKVLRKPDAVCRNCLMNKRPGAPVSHFDMPQSSPDTTAVAATTPDVSPKHPHKPTTFDAPTLELPPLQTLSQPQVSTTQEDSTKDEDQRRYSTTVSAAHTPTPTHTNINHTTTITSTPTASTPEVNFYSRSQILDSIRSNQTPADASASAPWAATTDTGISSSTGLSSMGMGSYTFDIPQHSYEYTSTGLGTEDKNKYEYDPENKNDDVTMFM